MIYETLGPQMFEPRDWEESAVCTALFREIAALGGDLEVRRWMNGRSAFVFTGIPKGYLETTPPFRIGVNKALLRTHGRDALVVRFTAAHELGHLAQLLRKEEPAQLFSVALFRQEVEASKFAIGRIGGIKTGWLASRYRSRLYHLSMAAESSFPLVFHFVFFLLIFSVAYALTCRIMARLADSLLSFQRDPILNQSNNATE